MLVHNSYNLCVQEPSFTGNALARMGDVITGVALLILGIYGGTFLPNGWSAGFLGGGIVYFVGILAPLPMHVKACCTRTDS